MLKKKNNVISEFTDRSFINYALIGVSGVAIDFLLYVLMVKLGVPAVLASVVSVSVAIVNNFYWNAHYNFKRKDHLWRRFLSFYMIGATGVVLSALFIILFHNIFGVGSIWAKLISVPFVVIFQYWFNKNSSFAVDHKQVPWRELGIFAICVLVFCIFAVNAPYFNFSDEADNLLGAQFIAHGGVLYGQYFSHHMPLSYFVGVPFLILLGEKIIAIKVAFGLVMATWLLLMSRHLHKKYGFKVFTSFTLLVSISQTLTWSHMVLAETLIGFACAHALILFITNDQNRSMYKDAITYALLGSIPALSALSYLPLSLAIYSFFIIGIIQTKKTSRAKVGPFVVFSFVAVAPYLIFLSYLALHHIGRIFYGQAITFNTQYYSQFSPDATISGLDSLLSIPQGVFDGLRSALLWQGANSALAFLFSFAVLTTLYLLIKNKKWLVVSSFGVVIFFGASRQGFMSIFSSGGATRNGTIIALAGMLLFCIVLFGGLISKPKDDNGSIGVTQLPIIMVLIVLVIASIAQVSANGRGYLRPAGTLEPSTKYNANIIIINAVNKPTDTYWIGPLDFSSQLLIHSKNASIYRFFAPWHAVCPGCVSRIESDLKANQPNVIILAAEGDIWGHRISEYSRPLLDSFRQEYYQVSDPRLKDFYFLKDNKAYINAVLSQRGYVTKSNG